MREGKYEENRREWKEREEKGKERNRREGRECVSDAFFNVGVHAHFRLISTQTIKSSKFNKLILKRTVS
jgi:hypothetical protein